MLSKEDNKLPYNNIVETVLKRKPSGISTVVSNSCLKDDLQGVFVLSCQQLSPDTLRIALILCDKMFGYIVTISDANSTFNDPEAP